MDAFVEPPSSPVVADLLLDYLDAYRVAAERKVADLTPAQQTSRPLPSAWTPLELVNHLAFMERRWLQWGFNGEDVSDPDGDGDPVWHCPDPWPVVRDRLRAAGVRTREIATGVDLSTVAPPGPRFPPDEPLPTLGWILLHVLQEYARHLGHLDAARELIDGATGE